MPANLTALSSQWDGQGFWLAIAAAGLIVIYLLMRPRAKKEPLAPPRFPIAKQRQVEEQMNTLLVELSQMAQQITAQLDTRAKKLELLIKDADERLAALQYISGSPPSPPPSDNSTSEAETTALHSSPPPASSAPKLDPRHEEVYAMADEGRSPNEIAKMVHRPAGEIELILALRPH